MWSPPEIAHRAAALRKYFESARGARLAIPLGGHPDPDALAAGWAFAELAAQAGLQPALLHAHPVSHAENRLMVRALGVPLLPFDAEAETQPFDAYALVDTQELDEAYSALAPLPCLAIWDHHEGVPSVQPSFRDIRRDIGATSAIAAEYLSHAGLLDPSSPAKLALAESWPVAGESAESRLATALLIGIATDTDDYLLAHAADFQSSAWLIKLANRPLFRRIHRRTYSVPALLALERALSKIIRQGSLGVAWVGRIPPDERDTIAQAADFLLSRADLDTVLVFARVGDAIDGSLRTLHPKISPARLLEEMLGFDPSGRPYGGGREGKGGFRLPLLEASADEIKLMRRDIEERFLKTAESLLQRP